MTVEIKLRGKYRRAGASKSSGKGKGSGNMGSGSVKRTGTLLPVGIRKHPRKKYIS